MEARQEIANEVDRILEDLKLVEPGTAEYRVLMEDLQLMQRLQLEYWQFDLSEEETESKLANEAAKLKAETEERKTRNRNELIKLGTDVGKTVLQCAVGVFIGGAVLNFEQTGVVTSKALQFAANCMRIGRA